jgi:DNA repair photolyase
MAPILPGLSDTQASIDETVRGIAEAGAASVTALPLHLRPGAREWYLAWLTREHPTLAPRYREMYARGAYLDQGYQREVASRVRLAARRHGLSTGAMTEHRLPQTTQLPQPPQPSGAEPEQLTLL